MRAAVLEKIGGKFTIEELRDPTPQAGEVLIRTAACMVRRKIQILGSYGARASSDLEAGKIVGRGVVIPGRASTKG